MVFVHRTSPVASIDPPSIFLQYVESTGNQYIDTGYKHNQNAHVNVDIQVLEEPTANVWAFEGRINTSTARQGFFLYKNSSVGYQWTADYGSQRHTFNGITAIGRRTLDFSYNVAKINSTSFQFNEETFQSQSNLFLLACNTGGNVSGKIKARLFSCNVWESGNLIRQYVPCKDSKGIVCLWDTVNEKYAYNAGTGEFIAGPEVVA